ncbi:hypothetical protein BJ741DRAFT_188210 [Chytriomyces cf. hyalinus JEL632]|nr:hypothetical protein BJ741DRAFT_188210 [Chytriomyces cf. hyalinus JEL632]
MDDTADLVPPRLLDREMPPSLGCNPFPLVSQTFNATWKTIHLRTSKLDSEYPHLSGTCHLSNAKSKVTDMTDWHSTCMKNWSEADEDEACCRMYPDSLLCSKVPVTLCRVLVPRSRAVFQEIVHCGPNNQNLTQKSDAKRIPVHQRHIRSLQSVAPISAVGFKPAVIVGASSHINETNTLAVSKSQLNHTRTILSSTYMFPNDSERNLFGIAARLH